MILFETNGFDYTDLNLTDDPLAENSVCKINYSEDYKQIHLAWIQIHSERTTRALHLSQLIITFNPSHYAAYIDRLELVEHFKVELLSELIFISTLILSNLKNYQVWNYREKIVKRILSSLNEQDGGDVLTYDNKDQKIASQGQIIKSELQFCHKTLESEPKNYHAFTYIYNLIPFYSESTCDSELLFTEKQLDLDVYNNSVWHYRLQLLKFSAHWKDDELELVFKSLEIDINNESIWAHIEGYFVFI